MKLKLNDRECEVNLYLNRKHTCDSFFESGFWIDDYTDLTENELILLEEENQDKIIEYAMENGGYRD
jgi:hypothetical protein